MSPCTKLIFCAAVLRLVGHREQRKREIEADDPVAARRELDGVRAGAAREVHHHAALGDAEGVLDEVDLAPDLRGRGRQMPRAKSSVKSSSHQGRARGFDVGGSNFSACATARSEGGLGALLRFGGGGGLRDVFVSLFRRLAVRDHLVDRTGA